MKLKSVNKEELENMSYDDIAFAILTEKKKKMKINDLFNEIGELINLSSAEIEAQIGDFFEMLTLDKRFIMLENGTWDLKTRHAGEVVIDEEEEDIALEDVEEEPIEEEEETEEIFYDEEEEDTDDDDLKDLVVIDEEEEDAL